ncbi:MAG: hypothetical protein ACFE9L_05125 [Candidatus Hodarchaeota archaeon]
MKLKYSISISCIIFIIFIILLSILSLSFFQGFIRFNKREELFGATYWKNYNDHKEAFFNEPVPLVPVSPFRDHVSADFHKTSFHSLVRLNSGLGNQAILIVNFNDEITAIENYTIIPFPSGFYSFGLEFNGSHYWTFQLGENYWNPFNGSQFLICYSADTQEIVFNGTLMLPDLSKYQNDSLFEFKRIGLEIWNNTLWVTEWVEPYYHPDPSLMVHAKYDLVTLERLDSVQIRRDDQLVSSSNVDENGVLWTSYLIIYNYGLEEDARKCGIFQDIYRISVGYSISSNKIISSVVTSHGVIQDSVISHGDYTYPNGSTKMPVSNGGHKISSDKDYILAIVSKRGRKESFLGFAITPIQKYNPIPFTNGHIGIIVLDVFGIAGCLIAFVVIFRKYIRKEPLFFK